MSEYERIRLVFLGGPGVGKSAIVKRFLFSTFSEKYRPTIEDVYNQEYDVGQITLKVNILDTAGDLQFPAMRRLSVSTAHAFVLVYAIDSQISFDQVKDCLEEIREQRADFQEIPIITVGNKADLPPNKREVEFDVVTDWIHGGMSNMRVRGLECSAKENRNVIEIFRMLYRLSSFSGLTGEEQSQKNKEGIGFGLRRRSSAYATLKSYSRNNPLTKRQSSMKNYDSDTTKEHKMRTGEASSFEESPNRSTNSSESQGESSFSISRSKPRSRSLIRRVSRKSKSSEDNKAHSTQDCKIT